MSIIKRIRVRNIVDSDKGINLKDAFKLVEDFELKEELINKFNINLDENPFLKIKGATTLVNSLINLDNKVFKFDVNTEISNIHIGKFIDKKSVEIELLNILNEEVLKKYRTNKLVAKSSYTVRADLLDGLYKADKFLTHLKSIEHDDLIDSTVNKLEELNKNNSNTRKLRFLEDEEGELYLRAITSTNVYKDYNNKFSVFIALYQLNSLRRLNYSFEIEQFSLNESEIYVLFKQVDSENLIQENVSLSFALELTNSEVKKKAVKLNGNFIIDTNKGSVYTKNDLNTTVLSISHGNTVTKAKKNITNLPDRIDEFISGSIHNYKNLDKIKKFEDIQNHLAERIEKSTNEEIKKYKKEFEEIFKMKVNSLIGLLDQMNKLESIIADEDIKAIEFIREKIYNSLIKKGRK